MGVMTEKTVRELALEIPAATRVFEKLVRRPAGPLPSGRQADSPNHAVYRLRVLELTRLH